MAGLPALALLYWDVESPRWLVQKGYEDLALREFATVARWNRRPIDYQAFTMPTICCA